MGIVPEDYTRGLVYAKKTGAVFSKSKKKKEGPTKY